jgi:hypothetical protein
MINASGKKVHRVTRLCFSSLLDFYHCFIPPRESGCNPTGTQCFREPKADPRLTVSLAWSDALVKRINTTLRRLTRIFSPVFNKNLTVTAPCGVLRGRRKVRPSRRDRLGFELKAKFFRDEKKPAREVTVKLPN